MTELLQNLPLWTASTITMVLFIAIAIAVVRMPRRSVYREAPDDGKWRDLRYWAVILISIQLFIYTLFG